MDLCVCEYCICPLEKFVFSAASSFLPDAAVAHLSEFTAPYPRSLQRVRQACHNGGTSNGSPVKQGKALSLGAFLFCQTKDGNIKIIILITSTLLINMITSIMAILKIKAKKLLPLPPPPLQNTPFPSPFSLLLDLFSVSELGNKYIPSFVPFSPHSYSC